MNAHTKPNFAKLSPREKRSTDPRVRDIWTGETIAHLSEDWQHYVAREQGRTGTVDTIETGMDLRPWPREIQ